MTRFDRITHISGIMGGKPCIRGMRITVGMILNHIALGRAIDDVLQDYPYLERADVLQAIGYAAWLAEERMVDLASA